MEVERTLVLKRGSKTAPRCLELVLDPRGAMEWHQCGNQATTHNNTRCRKHPLKPGSSITRRTWERNTKKPFLEKSDIGFLRISDVRRQKTTPISRI